MKKSILIAFLGNPFYDTRLKNLINSFSKSGYEFIVLGFEWEGKEIYVNKNVQVININRTPSIKFYLNFLYHLFKFLLKNKADFYFAEDVYSLGLMSIFSKIRRKKLFYNSRELYPFLAGLRERKFVQSLLAFVEKLFIKFPDYVLTTGEMDSEFLMHHYHLNNVIVLRNLPSMINMSGKIDLRKVLNIPEDSKILLYQGVLIDGRGIKVAIKLLQNFEKFHLVILGEGREKENFIKFAHSIGVNERVRFMGAVKQEDLVSYTAAADLGLALIENISLSYYYALPGKLFEYIMAELPVLCTDLPQMKSIVKKYNVGRYVDINNYDEIIKNVSEIFSNPEIINTYKQNCMIAKKELNWENEFTKLKEKLI